MTEHAWKWENFFTTYDSSIFGMALLFTEKREMKRRFASDNKEFNLRHIKFEIT